VAPKAASGIVMNNRGGCGDGAQVGFATGTGASVACGAFLLLRRLRVSVFLWARGVACFELVSSWLVEESVGLG
jgi:hypothetical protein